MPETCENWLGLVNSCVYYACQTCEIYHVLPYSVDFKAPGDTYFTILMAFMVNLTVSNVMKGAPTPVNRNTVILEHLK